MKPKERIMAALRMEAVDQIPSFHQYLTGGPEFIARLGLTMKECYYDPESFARACASITIHFGFDNIMAGWGSTVLEAHAHGTPIQFPQENGYPRSTSPSIVGPEDIEELEPIDPWSDQLLAVRLKASKLVQEEYGDDYAVMGSVPSPLQIASELRGYEYLLMDLIADAKLAHGYLSVLTESVKNYGEVLAELGIEIVFTEDDATAREGYLSLESNLEFDLPYAREALSHFRMLGLRTIVSNISYEPLVIDQYRWLEPDAIHFNPTHLDTEKVYNELRGRICVIPGIDETLVFEGDTRRIDQCVRSTFDSFGARVGIIMGAAYEIPFTTPWNHIEALTRAIRNL